MPRFLLLLLCASTSLAAAAQTSAPDTTRLGVRVGFALYPLWTPTQGFGVGGGVTVRRLPFPPSELRVSAFPAQYRGIYTASFFTHDPYAAPAYGLLSARYETTGRRWYYGLGPTSEPENQIAVEKEDVELEARLGLYLWRRSLLVQPVFGWRYDLAEGFRNHDDGAFSRLDAASQRNLLFALGDEAAGFPEAERRRTGLVYGLDVLFDRRDRRLTTRRGVLVEATARRFDGAGDADLRFDRFSASAYGFVPVTAASVLALRTFAIRVINRGGGPIPFYLLPALDGNVAVGFPLGRFYGNDLFLASAEYRFLVFNLINVIGFEGVVALSAASVYDDLLEQFRLGLTLGRSLPDDPARYPLRPTLGLGGRLVSLYEDRALFGGLVGFSAEGFSFTLSAFVHDLRLLRPRVR